MKRAVLTRKLPVPSQTWGMLPLHWYVPGWQARAVTARARMAAKNCILMVVMSSLEDLIVE